MNNSSLILTGVSKSYKLYLNKIDRLHDAFSPFGRKRYQEFFAVKNIDLIINKGDTIGIIGRNGSGKTTLLKLMSGITSPTSGKVEVSGNIVPLLQLGGGFHPDLTGIENIYYYTILLGYSKKETIEITNQVIDFAEIGDFIFQPIKTYSSGMRARLGFSVSINVDPDILIVDEVLAVGDEDFKQKSLARMHELFKSGKTIIYVSHSAKEISELCNRAIMLVKGQKVIEDSPEVVLKHYREYFKKP